MRNIDETDLQFMKNLQNFETHAFPQRTVWTPWANLVGIVKQQGTGFRQYRYLPLNAVPCPGLGRTLQSGLFPTNCGPIRRAHGGFTPWHAATCKT
jgi:hypothetical protein